MIAPPRPAEGAVSWNVDTSCNYRCTYCTQRFKDDRARWSRDTERFLAAFSRLPGRWEVKISGGEPFVHPTLDEIVAGLAGLGFRVSVVTNFSATAERIARFVGAARGRVGVFSASLHPEYVPDVGPFLDKALATRRLLDEARDPSLPPPGFAVTCVATRDVLPRLPGLAARFADAGVTFKVQPEKQDSRVVDYSPAERDLLVSLGGHNLTGEIDHRYRGRPCWAGARYFVLDDRGEAFRCYPARRARTDRLGNLLSPTFRLLGDGSPLPCRYESCHCSVPISRGMMSRSAEETSPAPPGDRETAPAAGPSVGPRRPRMGADQLTAIRPPLQELLAAIANRAPRANDLCLTFSVQNHGSAWVQVTHDTVNFAFPHSSPPLSFLRRHFVPSLPGEGLLAFESGQYATLSHRSSSTEELAVFVDRLLDAVHDLPPDYRLDVEFVHL